MVVLVVLTATGCSSLHYLLQAGKGQLELFNRARPIPDVIQDPLTSPRVKAMLSEIAIVKKFGEENGLKATSNYREFVKLDRSAAVWVVSACEPLRFRTEEWTFPVVGSVPYLGWFDLDDAKEFANELRQKGWDVDLGGASAYSTLGWFRDPVLSTMITQDDDALGNLVNVILHESVHATIYIKDQTYFNESVAGFVADALTREYLLQKSGSVELQAYIRSMDESEKIRQAMHEAYQKLSLLYSSDKSSETKLSEKQKIIAELKGGMHLKREINNATLIQYKTYHTGRDTFSKLFERCHKNWKTFFLTLDKLNESSFSQRQQENFESVILQSESSSESTEYPFFPRALPNRKISTAWSYRSN